MSVAPSAAPISLPRLTRHPTVAEYARHWMLRVRLRVRARSAYLYDFVLTTYLAPLGAVRLKDLRRADVQALVDQLLLDGKSVGTVRSALATLSALLNEATHDELVARNVAAGVARRLKAKPVRPPTIYQPEQIALFLTHAKTARPALAPLFALCAGAGLRVGEARAIRSDDLDFRKRQVRVERSIGSTDNKIGPPKSGKTRVVDLPTSTIAMVEPLRFARGWCFPGRAPGSVVSYSTVNYAMADICARAKIPTGSPHALRHALASHLAAKGVPLLYVQRLLGHQRIETTMHYADHLPMERPAELDAADFWPAEGSTPELIEAL